MTPDQLSNAVANTHNNDRYIYSIVRKSFDCLGHFRRNARVLYDIILVNYYYRYFIQIERKIQSSFYVALGHPRSIRFLKKNVN